MPVPSQGRHGFLLRAIALGALLSAAAIAPGAEDAGLRFFEERVRADPEDFIAQNQLAERFLAKLRSTGRLKWLARARTAAEASLHSVAAPVNSAGVLLSARVALASHRFVNARALSREYCRIKPERLEGLHVLFDAALEVGDYSDAAKTLGELEKMDPHSAYTASRQARLDWIFGKVDEAAKHWDEAVAHARGDARAPPDLLAWCLTQRGELAFRTGHPDDAHTAYAEAARLLPGDWGAAEHLAELHAARGEYDPALALLRTAIAATGRPELEQAAGDVALAAGRLDEAREFHDHALAAYRASIERGEALYVHHLAGFLCDVRPDAAEAVRLARSDLEERQGIQAHDALARWPAFRSRRGSRQSARHRRPRCAHPLPRWHDLHGRRRSRPRQRAHPRRERSGPAPPKFPLSPMTSRVLALLLLASAAARAHPVAQGTMEFDLHADRIAVRARVSNEEVFVASAFAGAKAPERLEDAWRVHGDYLLGKVEIFADGTVLAGVVEKVTPPADTSARGFVTYDIRYPLPAGRGASELIARQTLLREIEFAPGNRWEATFLVRVSRDGASLGDAQLFTHREPLRIPLATAAAPAPRHSVFRQYLRHGVNHILEGWDHLLFMAALVVATRRLWELVGVVTAFTLAHTFTLTLSVLDVVRLSPRIVEPVIAISIIAVAAQNVLRPAATHGPLRLALAFGFGLFHGLGFAGGLLDAMQGFTGVSVGEALAGFSIGVELGHQVVVLPIFCVIASVRALLKQPEARERFSVCAMRYASIAIAAAGTFYLVAALRG